MGSRGIALLVKNAPLPKENSEQIKTKSSASLQAQMQRPPPTRIDSSDEEDTGFAILSAKSNRLVPTKTEPETLLIRRQQVAHLFQNKTIAD